MASYHLEDDLAYSPVSEVWCVREQECTEDQKQEYVTCIMLVGPRRSSWWTSWTGIPRRVESWLQITANGLGTKMPWLAGVGLWMSVVYSSIVGVNFVPWKLNTACWGFLNSMAVLRKIQSTGTSMSITKSPMMPRMKARSTERSVLQMCKISCLGGVIDSSLRPGAGRFILT
ncbi:hypothetical protein CRG98_020845 [Punica granatum]|uniref:Uncharacterized protein n=1 Tax=Punica granatum TaxID=22663 RepID=A0A2I0JSA9_PUNGR|nr:hypothetical protein CRG98_020845 [Punica granatum]